MIYSDQIIENVRSANNIVDVVSARVNLTKKGRNFFGLCPFHDEKTPSFSVNPDRQIFYCFSCNKGGDVIRFVRETERLTFPEALQKLAERARIQLPESSDPQYNKNLAAAKAKKDRHMAMHAEAAAFYSAALMSGAGAGAREYLQGRMLRADTVKIFGLGYAGPEWDALYRHLKAKGYGDEEQTAGGLALKNKNGGYYDRFRDRIMFPICDASGRCVAFGGRALGSDGAKYMNSPETPLYSKGKNLYGLNLSKNTKERFFILVEGYMDLISLSANGVDNVVAPLGTALTDTQVQLLKRYTDDAVVAFDSDTAGQAAALRSLDLLEKQGFRVRVLTIPEGKDPDDYVKMNGPKAFRALVAEAAPLMDYRIASARRMYPGGGVENDVRFLKEAVRLLSRVGDAVEREVYISRIAGQYKIPESSIRADIERALAGAAAGANGGFGTSGGRAYGGAVGFGGGRTGGAAGGYGGGAGGYAGRGAPVNKNSQGAKAAQNANGGPAGRRAGDGPSPKAESAASFGVQGDSGSDELFIAALLSIDNTLWDIVTEKLPAELIDNQNVRQAIFYICERASQGKAVSSGELMWYLTEEEGDKFANIVTNGCHCEDNRRAIEQKIKDMRIKRFRRGVVDISKALAEDNLTEEDASRLRAQLSAFAKRA